MYQLQKERPYPPVDNGNINNYKDICILDHDSDKLLSQLDTALKKIEDSVLNPNHIKQMIKEEVVKNIG